MPFLPVIKKLSICVMYPVLGIEDVITDLIALLA